MYDYFHRELLKRRFATTDETGIQVLNEEGRTFANILSMPLPKENSIITVSLQFRESNIATGYSPLRTPLTRSMLVIMKGESSCVSRRKNLFWRLSGRDSTSRSLYEIPG